MIFGRRLAWRGTCGDSSWELGSGSPAQRARLRKCGRRGSGSDERVELWAMSPDCREDARRRRLCRLHPLSIQRLRAAGQSDYEQSLRRSPIRNQPAALGMAVGASVESQRHRLISAKRAARYARVLDTDRLVIVDERPLVVTAYAADLMRLGRHVRRFSDQVRGVWAGAFCGAAASPFMRVSPVASARGLMVRRYRRA